MIKSDDMVAFMAVFLIFGAPVAAWVVSRVLAHQERMEMLRRGFVPTPNARDMRRAMKHGWTPQATPANHYFDANFAAQHQLRRGIQVACIGFALLVGLGFIGYRGDGEYVYGPWLLGGLIPLFVGIAQILGAMIGGATFGPPQVHQPYGPPPNGAETASSQTQPNQSDTPPGPTYGGWRPGPIPEIKKPPTP